MKAASDLVASDYAMASDMANQSTIGRITHELSAFTQFSRASEALGTTLEYGKSGLRKGLRFSGVHADTAQDIVSAAEGATYLVGPVSSLAQSRVVGSAVQKVSRGVQKTEGALARFIDLSMPQPAYALSKSRALDLLPKRVNALRSEHAWFVESRGHGGAVAARGSGGTTTATAVEAPRVQRMNAADGGVSTRTKLFGTDEVAKFSAQRVRPINGRMPINAEYAGKTFHFDDAWLTKRLDGVTDPVRIQELKALSQKYQHGVPFTGEGKIDLSRYAERKVEIVFSGKSSKDIRLANKISGYTRTPKGFTWHHNHDEKMMHLVPTDLHEAVRHTGGDALARLKGGLK